MASVTTHYCDKCKKEVASLEELFPLIINFSIPFGRRCDADKGSINIDIEICENCAREYGMIITHRNDKNQLAMRDKVEESIKDLAIRIIKELGIISNFTIKEE